MIHAPQQHQVATSRIEQEEKNFMKLLISINPSFRIFDIDFLISETSAFGRNEKMLFKENKTQAATS